MKTLILPATIAIFGASMAFGQTMVEDSDGDGMFSMEEMLVTYPTLTEDLYGEIDVNDDGMVDGEELAAAQAAGLITG